MRVLVTGANGFVGSHVVSAFLRTGHEVAALMRPSADAERLPWHRDVEIVRADMRLPLEIDRTLAQVDAVVHLAARMGGGEPEQFATTVAGTERLLEALARTPTRRFVLASSYAVYDWEAISGALTEASPVIGDPYPRGPYTVAKTWQERLTRRMADDHGFELTVVRPGFVWGPGHVRLSGMGQRYGPFRVVFGRSTLLPLTYVENCADAFVQATVSGASIGETFNVVDDERVTNLRYTAEYIRRAPEPARLVTVPYPAVLALSRLGAAAGRRLFAGGGDLPDLFVPGRVEAQFKPLEFPNDKLHALGWRPRCTFDEALERSYPPPVP